MQLSRKSSARLEKLINALLTYCARKRRPDLLSGDMLKEACLPAAADIVWADDGDLTLIDAFVRKNPARLNRTDLRQVAGWKHALRGNFCFCRHGKDTVLLAGEYAFCVRGTDQELDDAYSEFPLYAESLILPFDGVLAHIGFAIVTPIADDPDSWNRRLVSAVDFLSEHRHLIRTERQFLQVSDHVEMGSEPYLPTVLCERTYEGDGVGRPGEDSLQRRGALSGLTFEERERHVLAHAQQKRADSLRRVAIHARPRTSYHEIFLSHSREILRTIAWDENLVLDTNELLAMTDEELARTLADNQCFSRDDIIDYASYAGHGVLELLRSLCDAGGCMRVSLQDLDLERWQFEELTHILYLFEFEDRHYLVTPDEVRTELSHVNWDECIAWSKRIDDAIQALVCALRFRGLVMLKSEIAHIVDIDNPKPGFERDMTGFRDAFLARVAHGAIPARIVYARDFTKSEEEDEHTLTAYVVPPAAYFDPELDRNDGVMDYDGEFEALATRALGPDVKPVPDLTWERYLAELASYRAAVAFLDAHVAFGHDDHEYADFVVDRLWAHVQKAEDDVASIVHVLANCGGADGPEQQATLTTLLENLARDLPCWHKGGYSMAEMAAAESR